MKLKIILLSILTFVCIVAAGILAYYGKEGWGWLVFLAFIILWSIDAMKPDS